MKINYTPQISKTMKTYGKKAGKAQIAKSPRLNSDKIDISSSAKDVNLASTAMKGLPDVRTEKISAIKEAIDNGTYHVSAMDIAEKMIEW